MKYVILIYANPKNWQHPLFLQYDDLSNEEHDRQLAKFNAFNVELATSGKMVTGSPLAAPETTKTITERNGGFLSPTAHSPKPKNSSPGF